MRIIIGLGNPGIKYARNRHNVGHLFVDSLQSTNYRLPPDIRILKSNVFMNSSGDFVKNAVDDRRIAVDQLYIVHDDLDIRLGDYKIQLGIGPKVHYGINSIEQALGTKEFWRVRIGVDNRDEVNRTPGEDYVLQDFSQEEEKILEALFSKIWEELCVI